MQVVILCGGRGTRIRDISADLPKPMVPIGGMPILEHLMRHYKHHGFNDFVLCTGYGYEAIEEHFLANPDQWTLECLYTGADTATGGRIKLTAKTLTGNTFLVSYGDNVSDVNLTALVAFHRQHGKMATLTAVRPICPWGVLEISMADTVMQFLEKPRMRRWINGGYFVFNRHVLDRIEGDATALEDVLAGLAEDGELMSYRHEGFWQCMDTPREYQLLNDLWATGKAPWKVWQ